MTATVGRIVLRVCRDLDVQSDLEVLGFSEEVQMSVKRKIVDHRPLIYAIHCYYLRLTNPELSAEDEVKYLTAKFSAQRANKPIWVYEIVELESVRHTH